MPKEKQEAGPKSQFPIFSYEDYDFEFNRRRGFPIGLKSNYPEELIARVSAARVSFLAHLQSVDYTRKHYLKDKSYETNDGSRLDLRVSRAIQHKATLLSDLIIRVSGEGGKRQGEIVGEWTWLRAPFTLKFILSCANKGALFETVAIARMLLEQIAWAVRIDRLDDEELIKKTSATKSISELKRVSASVGPLYNWMSSHAHWAYEGHSKAFVFEEDRLTALFASTKFKKQALALVIVLTSIAIRCFESSKKECIELVWKKSDTEPALSFDPLGEIRASGKELREALETRELQSLLDEIRNDDPSDYDVLEIAGMMPLASS